MKEIYYTKAALRVLRKMLNNTANRIRAKIRAYAADPTTMDPNITRLQGRDGIRLRVGDWRVIMDNQGAVLLVLKVGPRGDVYR